MKNNILTFCMLSLFLAACSKAESEEFSLGYFEGNRYFNEYFDFQITLPKAWSIQDQQTTKYFREMADALTGENKHMTVELFAVFKFMLGSPVDSNPNISCIAENLNFYPGVKTGSDYLFHLKREKRALYSAARLEYVFPKEIYTENLDGNDFDVLETELDLGVIKVKQLYYAGIVKGYAIGMALSYQTEAEKSELLDVIKTIEFSQRN